MINDKKFTAMDRVVYVMQELKIKQKDVLEVEPKLKQNTLSTNLKKGEFPHPLLLRALCTEWGVNLNWVICNRGEITQNEQKRTDVMDYLNELMLKNARTEPLSFIKTNKK